MKLFEASACAKIILAGEHAAVYGYPVIAYPLSALRATVTVVESSYGSGVTIVAPDLSEQWHLAHLEHHTDSPLVGLVVNMFRVAGLQVLPDVEIIITSDIPVASGLGSGAAVSVALVRAFSGYFALSLSDSEVNDIVYEQEKFYHGTPSGVDNTVIANEHSVYFVRGSPVRFLEFGLQAPFLVIDSGIAASTSAAVRSVRDRYLAFESSYFGDLVDALLCDVVFALDRSDFVGLGALFVQNHVLLHSVGVSLAQLDRIVFCLLEYGCYGVKLSGGGCGGNLIAVIDTDILENLVHVLGNVGRYSIYFSNDYEKFSG
jgi:mevalonate kinase